MAGVFATNLRVHFRQTVAVLTLVAFGVGWVAGHLFRRVGSLESGLNSPGAVQAAENTATPELRHTTNTAQIEIPEVNDHRAASYWMGRMEVTRRSSRQHVRAHTGTEVPVPEGTGDFLASNIAPPAPPQAENDVNKVAPPSTTAPSNGPENILPFFKAPEPCSPVAPTPPQTSAALSPDSLQPGALIHKVDPEYPPAALAQKVEGVVRIYAVTGADGSIKAIRPLSGPRMLIPAALGAVRQWRYSPTLLSGQPIESQRQITVAFQIAKTPLEP